MYVRIWIDILAKYLYAFVHQWFVPENFYKHDESVCDTSSFGHTEKLQALKEREDKFQEQFADFKERQEANFKKAVEEVKQKYEEEIVALKTKYGEPVKDKESVIADGETTKAES